MSYVHGESLMEDGDEVLRSSHHQSRPPLRKFHYRGCRGSRISRKLHAQGAAEGFKPFDNASSWRPPAAAAVNSIERNLEYEMYLGFETRKPPNGKFSKDFLRKRCWRSSGGPQHLNPTSENSHRDPSPMVSNCLSRVYREPASVKKPTLSSYTDQGSIRKSYDENYGLQSNSGHSTHDDRFQGQFTHFKHFRKKSRWSCHWEYEMDQDPSINFEHRFRDERVMDQKSHRFAYGLDHSQVVVKQQGFVQEICQERYKKHERWSSGGAPFLYKRENRNKHVWIRNSSHQEQTMVDSSISYHGKQQLLVPNSNLSWSTHEKVHAVVQKSSSQYLKEHKMQILGEQSTQYKPRISSTHDDESKVVKKKKSMAPTTQQALVQKASSPTDKEPHQRNRVVEKRSTTTQVECIAPLDSGPSMHKEHGNSQKMSFQSCQDDMSLRVVISKKKSLVQKHISGKEKIMERYNQDVTKQALNAQNKDDSATLSPKAQKSNRSSIHDETHILSQKLAFYKKPVVNQEVDLSINILHPLVHQSNNSACDQEYVTTTKSTRPPLIKKREWKPRKKLAMQKPSPPPATTTHHDPPKAKGGKADQDQIQLWEQNISAPKEHSLLKIPIDQTKSSCLDHDIVDQNLGIPTQEEQMFVQNSKLEANEDLGQVQNSTNLVEISLLKLLELIFMEEGIPTYKDIVCQTCGDVGYWELLIYCTSCKSSAQHRYCMSGHISMDKEDLTWVCENCVGRFPELDSLNKHQSRCDKKAPLHGNRSFVNNTTQNDRKEVAAVRKDSNFKIMINGSEKDEGSNSNLHEDGDNHNSSSSSEGGSGSSFPQDEDFTNEDIHFIKRKRSRQFIIYESEEEIDDDLTLSDASKEGHVHGIPSICDMSPELKARPMIDPIWRGWFEICGRNYGMLLGHLSSKACLRVCEGANLLEHVIRVEMLPRADSWPKTFERSPPTSDSIGLYFFPENLCDEKMFDKLVNEINSQDLALKVILGEIELLIFSSSLLQQNTRLCGKYYLWGAFRARQKLAVSRHPSMDDDPRRIPNPKASSVWGEEMGRGEELVLAGTTGDESWKGDPKAMEMK